MSFCVIGGLIVYVYNQNKKLSESVKNHSIKSCRRLKQESEKYYLASHGMGFLIRPNLLVTNCHVVEHFFCNDRDSKKITIINHKNEETIFCPNPTDLDKLVFLDNEVDLALIRLDQECPEYINLNKKPITLKRMFRELGSYVDSFLIFLVSLYHLLFILII